MQLQGCIPKSCVAGLEIDLCKELRPITLDTKYETLVVDYTFLIRVFFITPKYPIAHLYISQYIDLVHAEPPCRQPAHILQPHENLSAIRLTSNKEHRALLEVHITLNNNVSFNHVHSLHKLTAGRFGIS